MNQRKAGALLSYVHILVTTVISLIYTPYMLRALGQGEYGLYSTAGSFVSYLSVLSFGIGGSYIRFNSIARAKGDKEEEKQLNGMYLAIFFVLSLFVLFGGVLIELLAARLVKQTFSTEELYKLRIIIAILVANTMIAFICNVFMMSLQSYEEFFCIRVVLLVSAVIQPILNVITLKNGGKAISITLLSFILSALSYTFFIIYAHHKIRFEISFKGFRKDVLKEITFFSGYLFLNSLTDQITFSTDGVILSATKGAAAVAVYNIGAMFKGYFMQMSTAISSVFAPKINQIVANKCDTNELDVIFTRVGRIQFYVVSLILIGYCSIGKSFIRIWAGAEYIDSYYIGLLLMLAISVPLFQNVGIEIQKAMNRHKARSIVYFLISLFNIVLTIPFCRLWGGIGAALATTICMFMGTVVFMNIYYGRIGLDMLFFWKNILKTTPGLLLPSLCGYGLNRYLMIDSYAKLLFSAVFISIAFVISIWGFSMNQYEKELLRSLIKHFSRK